jgi:hypothetical protein
LSKGRKKEKAPRTKGMTHAPIADDPSNWLGLDSGFDARNEGKTIGSWDNFEEVGEDDGFAWKGGFAGDDPIEDNGFAVNEAARIRRKITDALDVNLSDKEIWFVATGAHFAGRVGMRAFLSTYQEHLRDALIINLVSLGAGDLYWTTKERFAGTRICSARLTSLARRVSREKDLRAKALRTRAPQTDAGPALAAGRRAISLLRLTPKGLPFAWASEQDTAARLDVENIDEAAAFVCELIREA